MIAVGLFGEGDSLIDNVKTYSDKIEADAIQDYHIAAAGHNSIIRNCYSETINSINHQASHGIGIRGSWNNSNNYNLLEKQH